MSGRSAANETSDRRPLDDDDELHALKAELEQCRHENAALRRLIPDSDEFSGRGTTITTINTNQLQRTAVKSTNSPTDSTMPVSQATLHISGNNYDQSQKVG